MEERSKPKDVMKSEGGRFVGREAKWCKKVRKYLQEIGGKRHPSTAPEIVKRASNTRLLRYGRRR